MNSLFKSFLSQYLKEYVNYRKTLGFKITSLKSNLKKFDRYLLSAVSPMDLSPSFFLEFRKNINGSPRTINNILSAVRGFYSYMVRNEYVAQNPLLDIPPYKENAFIPFIFSAKETDEILYAVGKRIRRDKKYFLNDMMVYAAIMLLARCGMRISEPLKLHLKHYCRDDTIYIEKTKFYKDRLIPVPRAVSDELNNYLAVRKILFCDDNPYLFPGKTGKGISANRIYPVFHRAIEDIGITERARIVDNMRFGAPTPHSLRHSFAANTLKRIKDKGKSPQQALPVLSVYMGHSKYRYTAVYLKLTDAKHRRHLVDFTISRQEEL
ncbi:MAG: tyrosine-type recombinase/integrase [Thermodesulfobacteriota bacterium]|nr:tyrosine-type recombinase/integrase [Thermodesulfobacteriota bacterium]